MVKKLSATLLCICLIASVFAACSTDSETADTAGSLEDSVVEYGFEVDEDGNTVAVVYEDGVAYVLDSEGNKTGEIIENPQNMPTDTSSTDSETTSSSSSSGDAPSRVPDRTNIANNTDDADETTESELTTLPADDDSVPSTSESGTSVSFSDADVTTITNMLEVPYLYLASYENTDSVPIEIATHVACWMMQRENTDTYSFASGTVVIDLFNYFARTVVGFKSKCNQYTADGIEYAAPIQYNSSSDTFTITSSSYETRTHTVTITEIQDLGSNNYYKVIGEVEEINDSGCTKTKVVAVIQKNKLDTSLGFSVKALKWS